MSSIDERVIYLMSSRVYSYVFWEEWYLEKKEAHVK